MLEWSFWPEFWQQHALLLMFGSAFLSATVLPGNSEIVFIGLAAAIQLPADQYISAPVLNLLFCAVAGNSLGSLSTYWIGRWLPQADFDAAVEAQPSSSENNRKRQKVRWVFTKILRYGSASLLLSWLPVVGDLFCAMAGWLRLPWTACLVYIVIGKALRYAFLLHVVTGYAFYR